MGRNKQLEEIRSFVVRLLNDEQDSHSKLIEDLTFRLGESYMNSSNTRTNLDIVHETRVETLEKILNKIKEYA